MLIFVLSILSSPVGGSEANRFPGQDSIRGQSSTDVEPRQGRRGTGQRSRTTT